MRCISRLRHAAYCSQVDSLPDDARRLAARLEILADDPDWAPWPTPLVLATVGSTMEELRERAEAGAPDGTSIVADEQTAGRGRHGRTWQSPPGTGVWASVLLRPGDIPANTLGVLPLLIGSNLAGVLSQRSGAHLWFKWPNDIVWAGDIRRAGDIVRADNVGTPQASSPDHAGIAPDVSDNKDASGNRLSVAKVAGILAERLSDGAIVIGVGLNVLSAPEDAGAIALADIADDSHREGLSRAEAAVDVLHAVSQSASAWSRGEHDLDDYRARCITLGRRVSVTTVAGAESWQGMAMGVDGTGLLLVESATGTVTAVSAGDVTLAE